MYAETLSLVLDYQLLTCWPAAFVDP